MSAEHPPAVAAAGAAARPRSEASASAARPSAALRTACAGGTLSGTLGVPAPEMAAIPGPCMEDLARQAPTPEKRARALGLDIPAEVAPAAHYALGTAHAGLLYLSGQLPRVGGQVAVAGRVGEDVSLTQARRAAQLCTLRALGALRQILGSLDHVERVLKLQVFVQCAPDFIRHSEVADAASELLVQVFGSVGLAARTAVGVYQLPQRASVELDLVVAASASTATSKEQHAVQR